MCYDRRDIIMELRGHQIVLCKLDKETLRYDQLTIVLNPEKISYTFNRTEAETIRYRLLWCSQSRLSCLNKQTIEGCHETTRYKMIVICYSERRKIRWGRIGRTLLTSSEVEKLEEIINYWF